MAVILILVCKWAPNIGPQGKFPDILKEIALLVIKTILEALLSMSLF